MKVVVTGACGMLATRVCKRLSGNHEVIPTDIQQPCGGLDICDTTAVLEFFDRCKPDMVIHCAAMTDVDGCTRNPDAAFKVNAVGTWSLACAAAKTGASMAYVSTDYVFDGEKGEPYTEFDSPNPINAYGSSKLAGEQAVKELLKNFYIVRTSWLYASTHRNFPISILNNAKAGKDLRIIKDQMGSPTYADDLADFLVSLVGSPCCGTYHFTNSGFCTWYNFARKILDEAGMADIKIVPIKSEEWPTPTRRPKYSVLRHYRLELAGRDNARPWEEAVAEFVREWTTVKQ